MTQFAYALPSLYPTGIFKFQILLLCYNVLHGHPHTYTYINLFVNPLCVFIEQYIINNYSTQYIYNAMQYNALSLGGG